MKHKRFWETVEIDVSMEGSGAVEFALDRLDAVGTQIGLYRPDSRSTTVTGYFNDRIPGERLEGKLTESLKIYGLDRHEVFGIHWERVADRDWLAEWKKHWKPTVFRKLVVAPPWSEISAEEKTVVWIEPNMAFGTGTHETTKLCINGIERYYSAGMSFLDVGTGTGILAIAATVLGKADRESENNGTEESAAMNTERLKFKKSGLILACDVDGAAVAIARENARLNGTSQIDFFTGTVTDSTPVLDFVCANLTAGIILEILPLLLRKSKRILVLSGILEQQVDGVVDNLARLGAEAPLIAHDGEWASVTVLKESGRMKTGSGNWDVDGANPRAPRRARRGAIWMTSSILKMRPTR